MKSVTSNTLSLYIGSIPTTLNRKNIINHFLNLGIKMKINNKKSRPDKRYYVVDFDEENQARFILSNINTHYVEGHHLVVGEYLTGEDKKSQDEKEKGKKLYIGNLPKNTLDSEIKAFLEQFGRVKSAYVKNKNKNSRKNFYFGFVTFENVEVAKRVKSLRKIRFKDKNIFFREFKSGNESSKNQSQENLDKSPQELENQTKNLKKGSLSNDNRNHKKYQTEQDNEDEEEHPEEILSNFVSIAEKLEKQILTNNRLSQNPPNLSASLQLQQPPSTYYSLHSGGIFRPRKEHFEKFREQFYFSPSRINRYKASTPEEQRARLSQTNLFSLTEENKFGSFRRELRLPARTHNPVKYGEYKSVERDSSIAQAGILRNVHLNHFDNGNLRLNFRGYRKF